jgi:hypothetical protein
MLQYIREDFTYPKREEMPPMKNLVFPFVEIEVPDDFPSGLDFEAVDQYINQHPEIGVQIIYEYETAYRKWVKNEEKNNAQTTHQPYKAKARSQRLPESPEN